RGLDVVGVASGLAAAALALSLGRGPISRPGAWAGVLLLGLAAATAAQIAAPLTAYVLAWPLVLGAIAAAASDLAADQRRSRLAALAVIAALGAAWAGVHAHLIIVVVGLPELLCLPLLMATVTLWPLAQPEAGAPPARLPGRALILAGLALVAVVRLTSPWSDRHPQASFVAYQLDQDAGRAWRIARPDLRTAWSDAVLQADGGRIAPFRHWAWDAAVDAAPARLAAVPPPAIVLARGADGLLRLTVTAPPGARTLALQLSPDTPSRLVGVGSAPADLALAPGRWTKVAWAAPPAAGLTLTIRPAGPGALRLRYAVGLDGWPAGVAPPRPAPPAIMGLGLSGEALATGSRTLTW
ncbi:MAG: peptidase family, partial [Phenylobacterium sp.]|nr:peptidase family [Phenylobacterium sp.]